MQADAQALEVHQRQCAAPGRGRPLPRTLAESAVEARVLGPMLLKELHFRLLVSPLGHMLRSLLRHDSHASAIMCEPSRCLRRDFRAPMVVEKLARNAVGAGVSSFHKHFKGVTSSSPLRYQKDLHLLEARRLLVAGTATVTALRHLKSAMRAPPSSAGSTPASSGDRRVRTSRAHARREVDAHERLT